MDPFIWPQEIRFREFVDNSPSVRHTYLKASSLHRFGSIEFNETVSMTRINAGLVSPTLNSIGILDQQLPLPPPNQSAFHLPVADSSLNTLVSSFRYTTKMCVARELRRKNYVCNWVACDYDVIAFMETWLHSGIPDAELSPWWLQFTVSTLALWWWYNCLYAN